MVFVYRFYNLICLVIIPIIHYSTKNPNIELSPFYRFTNYRRFTGLRRLKGRVQYMVLIRLVVFEKNADFNSEKPWFPEA